jgi:hypothetical protein
MRSFMTSPYGQLFAAPGTVAFEVAGFAARMAHLPGFPLLILTFIAIGAAQTIIDIGTVAFSGEHGAKAWRFAARYPGCGTAPASGDPRPNGGWSSR